MRIVLGISNSSYIYVLICGLSRYLDKALRPEAVNLVPFYIHLGLIVRHEGYF